MLNWPQELASAEPGAHHDWLQPGTNICLDFHGDPVRAQAVIYADGNHHMALATALRLFVKEHPAIQDVFYATTPPGILLAAVRHGLRLGNLVLSRSPDIFIGPGRIIQQLSATGLVSADTPFMQSRGNVILLRAGNPRHIKHVTDLWRQGVRLALSNPDTETASHQVYRQTLDAYGAHYHLPPIMQAKTAQLIYSEGIHHREIPQILADGKADAAIVYYHLALRYQRIFPELFSFVNMKGLHAPPENDPQQTITEYRLALIRECGPWGGQLYEFLAGDAVSAIYREHGLARISGD